MRTAALWLTKLDTNLIVVPQASKATPTSGTISLEVHPAVITGRYFRGWMLAEMYAHIVASRDIDDNEAPKWDHDPFDDDLKNETREDAANTLEESCGADQSIASRGMDDNEAPTWDYDPIDEDLKDETRQDAANTLEESCGADQSTLPSPFFGMGAHFDDEFDDESTDLLSELDHMTNEDQTRQHFQRPGSFMQSSNEALLRPETSASNYFLPGQHGPRHYSSSPIPYTSIEQSHSPASTSIARTAPTSLLTTGPQSSLLSHTTSAATTSSLDGSGVCPQCGYKVSTAEKPKDRNNNVNRHMREQHRQGQSVKCPEGDHTSQRSSNEGRHIRLVHQRHSND